MPYTVVVDVHLILRRGDRVLLAERANSGYADGALHLPAGKLEPGEDVAGAVIREAEEELGIRLPRDAVAAVHVMQHRNADGHTRIGWFFAADGSAVEPVNAEPDKCAGLLWVPLDELPERTWPYTVAGLAHYRAGTPFSMDDFTGQPQPA